MRWEVDQDPGPFFGVAPICRGQLGFWPVSLSPPSCLPGWNPWPVLGKVVSLPHTFRARTGGGVTLGKYRGHREDADLQPSACKMMSAGEEDRGLNRIKHPNKEGAFWLLSLLSGGGGADRLHDRCELVRTTGTTIFSAHFFFFCLYGGVCGGRVGAQKLVEECCANNGW